LEDILIGEKMMAMVIAPTGAVVDRNQEGKQGAQVSGNVKTGASSV
jgi:hypothetical protein